MLSVDPIIRLVSAMLIVVTIFLTKSVLGLLLIYSLVLILLLSSRVILNHFRFVFYVTMPMLLALIILWGLIIDNRQIPLSNVSGIEYALFLWLRILSWGGVLQFLFLPLVEMPSHLNEFLRRAGLSGSFGTLIIASIIFLPEMRRRLSQIVDARRAQGIPLRGLKGVKDIPTLLMPLIASLLDSAAKRSELWSHRGILETVRGSEVDFFYSRLQGAFVLMLSIASCVSIFLT